MQNVVLWNAPNRRSQLSQNVSEQTKIDVHMDRFADIFGARLFEGQRDAGGIHSRIEPRRAFESADVKFIGILQRDLRLIRDRFRQMPPCGRGDACDAVRLSLACPSA
jgi:hypothetical protein